MKKIRIRVDDIVLIILLALICGFVFGEKKQCESVNGKYEFEYGKCFIRE